jgi:hypothetical protein
MKIKTECTVELYYRNSMSSYNTLTFDNLTDAINFQQSAIKANENSGAVLTLTSTKEKEVQNEQP